uniref:Uncharacterized protein n=1 Tax=Anguilla anguilla TaxID=7936 RepID=A0A0E9R414_ANGAN
MGSKHSVPDSARAFSGGNSLCFASVPSIVNSVTGDETLYPKKCYFVL